MRTKNNNGFNLRLLQGAAWLPLLTFAWLQLTLASHHFDHVAEYFSDSCHVCMQLDRLDDTSVDHSGLETPTFLSTAVQVVGTHGVLNRALTRQYDSRAPPQL